MDSEKPKLEELKNLTIDRLGEPKLTSPLVKAGDIFVDDSKRVLVYSSLLDAEKFIKQNKEPPSFEMAGPRAKIFFNTKEITCGIVTCGGLCPGLNDVIRTIALSLSWQYGVKKVLGFLYGYNGLSKNPHAEPIEITPPMVDGIQHQGGTILGSSRDEIDISEMVDTLIRFKVSILFTIGGDGTFHAAHLLAEEIKKRKLPISIIGIPKTIDNDIYCCERSFGLSSAVEEARKVIYAAHEEARAAYNGIGLVKLMGRDSGFIAAYATLSNSDVNFCLIPEVPIKLESKDGFLELLEKRLERKRHAVIVVAEGVGKELLQSSKSSLDHHNDIGIFLKESIIKYFAGKKIPLTLKYIDPSYTIRSCPADGNDASFCLLLGQMAVHAAVAGRSDMFVGYWNDHFTHVPLELGTLKKKKIDTKSELWQTLLQTTGQTGRPYN